MGFGLGLGPGSGRAQSYKYFAQNSLSFLTHKNDFCATFEYKAFTDCKKIKLGLLWAFGYCRGRAYGLKPGAVPALKTRTRATKKVADSSSDPFKRCTEGLTWAQTTKEFEL